MHSVAGNMRSDAYAHESARGTVKHPPPAWTVHPATGMVQLNEHSPAALYLGDLTQYGTAEDPYQTPKMAGDKHALPQQAGGHHTREQGPRPWEHFKPVGGYMGFVPRHGHTRITNRPPARVGNPRPLTVASVQ